MREWIAFIAKILAALGIILITMLMLNLSGDCEPEVTHCGELGRRISFLVLAFGLIGVGYYAYLFISSRLKR